MAQVCLGRNASCQAFTSLQAGDSRQCLPNNFALSPKTAQFPSVATCHQDPVPSPPHTSREGMARHGTAGEPKRAAGRAGGKTCISDSQTKISSHVSTRLSIVPETTPPLPNTNKNPQNLILWDSNHTAFMEK